ncbi:hypothetical protein EJB05_33864 [Eragrostis curvula]|uniref:DRBM domain-containing protein n=1 Tax=Eragrostis curvula TaxID=38414 RepID=A0A5J9U2Y8_9POAL|nr:hypothetical protein EJB05_33864 [Eragrostis curvula]
MYKNQLQELAQRSCFNLPSYACIREGPDHAPRFKATVNFNGETFESPVFCSTLRQAEHAAAEVALNELSKRGPSSSLAAKVLDETGIYKNLLQETAHRAGLKLPVYTTIRSGPGHTPLFTCTVELAGMAFTGSPGKTKKQAQKNAAMAAWSELKQLPRVGEPSSPSCPPDQDDEEQEQAYPSIPPDQAMYHVWHRMQTTQATPCFPMVPAMGNTRFPPPAAMLSIYPPPQGQFATPASQDAIGLLPCFPEAAPALPPYFSPYPVSYVSRSPLPGTVQRYHGKRQECAEIAELPDAAVFSQYTSVDSSCTSVYGGPRKVQELPKLGEDCTESSASPEEENKALLAVSSSATHPSSQKLEPNEDTGPSGNKQAESKKAQEQPPKSLLSWGPSVPPCVSSKQKQYTLTVQRDEPIHRNNHPQSSLSASSELWSSRLQAAPRFGTAVPVNSLGSVFQQRPPWLAAPVTVRTAIPVCSARPNVVNNAAGAAGVRPNFQNSSSQGRGELEPHRNDDERNLSGGGAANLDLSKLHI